MAAGGLADLPVPDDMFYDDSYAGGGVVAFAGAGPVVEEEEEEVVATDYFRDRPVEEIMAERQRLYQPSTTNRDRMAAYWEQQASPEAMAKGKKEDMWSALAQIGFGMAGSNSPHFMQAAGQAATAAIPGMQAARKERKSEQRAGMAALADLENMSNSELRAALDSAIARRDNAASVREKRAADAEARALSIKLQEMQGATTIRAAQISASGRGGGSGGDDGKTLTERYATQIYASLRDNPANAGYSDARLRRQATQTAVRELAAAEGGNSPAVVVPPDTRFNRPAAGATHGATNTRNNDAATVNLGMWPSR
jgi:hypothetical protein